MNELKNISHRIAIGQRIAEIRKSKGLSLRQLSEICGVTYQNITKIENGRYNVSIDILGKVCAALGCEIKIEERI